MWKVVLACEQNPKKHSFKLSGYGLKPTLKISEEEIKFMPTVPYVKNYEKFFSIENVSAFPIEFFLSDFDT